MTVTRRTLVRMATALAAAGATAVETVTAAQTSSPQAPTASSAALPNDELTAARAQLQRNAQQLAEVKLPPDTEPAFHFKA